MIANRFEQLYNELSTNQRHFAETIGYNQGTLSRVEAGTVALSKKMKRAISGAFPRINVEWLETGNGEMYVSASTAADVHKSEQVKEIRPNFTAGGSSRAVSIIAESLRKYDFDLKSITEVERIRNMLDMLLEILVSKSEDTKNAIESNLFTFQHTVREEQANRQKDEEIEGLKKMNTALSDRIERLEKLLNTQNQNDFKTKES